MATISCMCGQIIWEGDAIKQSIDQMCPNCGAFIR